MVKTILSKLSEKEKAIFLGLTIIAGILILWPLHNFQYYLSQGDHGRDLYCFQKVLEGAIPYQDFSWLFGPLMPYYYGLCYLLGGVSIQSILLGQIVLIFLSGIFIYRICCVFLPPGLSFVCAFWYWSFRGTEFFYTYNHIGGLLALLITLYCALKYIANNKHRYIYAGFLSILALMLIRLNMGVSILIAFVPSLLLTDALQKDQKISEKRKLYLLLALGTLTIAFLIYWFLLHPLPEYAISQSFPYGKTQRTDVSSSLLGTAGYSLSMLSSYFTATLSQKIFGLILLMALIQCVILISSNKSPKEFRKNSSLVFCSLFFFLILSSHEFVASGVFYRIYWFFPIILIIIFYLIATSIRNISSPVIKSLVILTLFLPAFWNIQFEIRAIKSLKNPEHQLSIGANKIYTLQRPPWFQTVTSAVTFLKDNTLPTEKILVLPLDPLYLFLSQRDSAVRQLVFFEHIKITEEQEKATIAEMESNKANWVLISNRVISPGDGMGVFGKTHCLLLAQYLRDHFSPSADFGNWMGPPGWAWNHSVQILKRKTPSTPLSSNP